MVKRIAKLTKYLTNSLQDQDLDLDFAISEFLDLLLENGFCKQAFIVNNTNTKFFSSSNVKEKDIDLENPDLNSYAIGDWGHLYIFHDTHPEKEKFWMDLVDSIALFMYSAELKIKTEITSTLTSEIRKTLRPDLAIEKIYLTLKSYADLDNFYFFTRLLNVSDSEEELFKGYSLSFYNGENNYFPENLSKVMQFEEVENHAFVEADAYTKTFKVRVTARGREWGVIVASRKKPWTSDLERTFEIFAEQMATVFNQHELHNESLTLAQREFLLNQITTKIRESLVVNNIIDTAVQEIAQVMSVESCGLIILDRKISYSNHKTWSISDVYDQSMSEALYAILKTELEPSWFEPTILIGDLELSENHQFKRLKDIGLKSLMLSGLFKDDTKELVAILEVGCFAKLRNWTYDEQLLLEGAAKQLEIALMQAAIYQESQQTKRQMALLHKLSNDIRDSLDISVVMGQIAKGIGEVLGLNRCFVRRFAEDYNIFKTEEEYCSNGYAPCADMIFGFEKRWIEKLTQINKDRRSFEVLNIPSIKLMLEEENSDLIKIAEVISLKSYLAVPLIARGKLLGTINIHQCDRERLFLPEEIEFVFRVASEAAIALEHAALFDTINKFNKMDPDTGLYNKRYFREVAESEILKAKQNNRNISFMLVDVDHLKDINDNSEFGGHEAGDEAIRILSEVLSNTVRQTPVGDIHRRISDIVGRFGGDEFIVLLPNTHIDDAVKVANRIANNLAKAKHSTWPKPLTCSMGVSGTPHDEYNYESFKTQADKALYLSKRKGRNAISSTLEL